MSTKSILLIALVLFAVLLSACNDGDKGTTNLPEGVTYTQNCWTTGSGYMCQCSDGQARPAPMPTATPEPTPTPEPNNGVYCADVDAPGCVLNGLAESMGAK